MSNVDLKTTTVKQYFLNGEEVSDVELMALREKINEALADHPRVFVVSDMRTDVGLDGRGRGVSLMMDDYGNEMRIRIRPHSLRLAADIMSEGA